jgi:PAS domain S-box-containing protein
MKKEARLQDVAERYLSIAAEVILSLDARGNITMLNESGHRLLGYAQGELIGKNWFDECVPVDVRNKLKTVFAKLMAGEGSDVSTYENQVITKSGETLDLLWHNTVLRDSDGHITGTLSSAEDITQRKKMEEELRNSEEQYRMLFTGMDIGVFFFKPGGTISYANPAALDILGVTEEEITSLVPTDSRWKNIQEDGSEYPDDLLPSTLAMHTGQAVRDKVIGIYNGREKRYRWVIGSAIPRFHTGEKAPSLVYVTMMDITEQKKAEELQKSLFLQVQEEKERLDLLIASMSDEVWFADTAGHFTLENPAACKAFGLEKPGDIDIQSFAQSLEVFRPDGSPRPIEEAPPLRALRGQTTIEQEQIVRLPKSGQLRYRLVTSNPVRDFEGNITGCISVVHDITDKKQAELRIEHEKAFFDHLIEMAPEGIAITDKTGIILKSNAEFCRMFGYSQEEALGKQIDDLIAPPEREAEARNLTASLMHGGTVSVDTQRRRKDGSLLDVWVIGAPIIVSGREEAVFAIYRDISEKKKLEREREKETARLKSLVSILQHQSDSLQEFLNYALDQAICLTDSKIGYIYHCNEEKQHFTLNTWSRDVMPACTVIDQVKEYDLRDTGFWGEVVRKRKPLVNNDFSAPNPYKKGTPEGHVPLSKFMSIPVFSDGKIVGVIGLANKKDDYTETDILQTSLLMETVWKVVDRLKAEDALKKLNDELEKRISQRTAALESANKELESFSYSVSHDLRAPLRAIDGYVQIFLENYQKNLDDEAKRIFSRISENARRMGQLIDDLLRFSRTAKLPIARDLIDMTALVKQVVEEILAPIKDINYDIEISALEPATGDISLIRQVWMNLIGNAVKFSRKAEKPHIRIFSERVEGKVVYTVEDNGAGFNMEYADKLFGVFQRLHGQNEFEGTGVGLALVKRILTRHSGNIWAEGQVGQGAKFHFSIGEEASDA